MLDTFPVPRRLWPTTPPPNSSETLHRFMLPPQSTVATLPDPPLDGSLTPLKELMQYYPAVLLRTNWRLRGAEEVVLPRL